MKKDLWHWLECDNV